MSNPHLMGRRQFLVLSSTCAVAAAAIGPRVFAGEKAQPRRLAVGFARFEENASVVAASGIPAGDGGFIGRGARITVSGASGASADPRERRAVELLAHYSYFDGAERRTAPFRAWACNRATGCQGGAVGFTVPVDEVQRIELTFGIESGAPAGPGATTMSGTTTRRDALAAGATESTALPLTLTLQNEKDAVKLARGFYVVAPLFDGDSEPRWSAWSIRLVDGRFSLVDADGNTAPFEHFVLRVDYAPAV